MTMAAPVALSLAGKYTVSSGMSLGSLPTAPGAPSGQRAMGFGWGVLSWPQAGVAGTRSRQHKNVTENNRRAGIMVMSLGCLFRVGDCQRDCTTEGQPRPAQKK